MVMRCGYAWYQKDQKNVPDVIIQFTTFSIIAKADSTNRGKPAAEMHLAAQQETLTEYALLKSVPPSSYTL